MDYAAFFKGKKITVMGMGLLGGIGDIRFLAESGAALIVTDLKKPEELQASVEALRDFQNVSFVLGQHRLEDFQDRDLIIKAPATPIDSPYIAEARKNNIPITMWAALFARFAKEVGAPIVGVTGTRGKTTVTEMIAAIARAAGKRSIVGGNVPGTSMLTHLKELSSESVVILELDSWKIQGFREEKISPDIAVFTSFYPDHLDYYRGDMEAYLADKAEIFIHQNANDVLILGEQCAELVQEKYKITSTIEIARAADCNWKLLIPGKHNQANAACALHAARALGIADTVSKQVLESFTGVPGRLQMIREVRGIQMYNDTTATTPEATIAALQALDPDNTHNIVLIMGGADKGLDMSAMRAVVHAHCKKVFFLAGTGTERIHADAPDTPVYNSLKEATEAAMSASVAGDIVLFSPAFASFGMFKNEYDRGEQFMRIVQSLT